MNTKKLIVMMAAALCAVGNLAAQQPTSDLKGEMLSSRAGIPVATGEAVLPQLVRSYAPGFTATELYASPEELRGKAVSQELLGRIVYSIAGIARGQGEMGGKIWATIWTIFGTSTIVAGFWTFTRIGSGRASTDDAGAFVLRFVAGFIVLKWVVGALPNAAIASVDWLTASLSPSGAQLEQVERAYALKLIGGIKAQAGENAAYAAGQVILDLPSSKSGELKIDEDGLRAKYLSIFVDGFFRLGDTKYGDADSFAAAVVEAAKRNQYTERRGWKGIADSLGNFQANTNPTLLVGKLLFGSNTDIPWDKKTLDEKRALISQVVGNSAMDASKGVLLAVKEDVERTDTGLIAWRNNVSSWFERASGMSLGEILSAHQNIYRKIGNAFAAPAVDKTQLESSYKWITFALRWAAFVLAVTIWCQPFIWAASAIALPFSASHLGRAIKGAAGLLVMAAVIAALGQVALDAQISRVTGATKTVDTGSWLAAISGLDVEMMAYAALIIIAPPILAIAVVTGASSGIAAVTDRINQGGMSGPGTGGGWTSAVGKSLGLGGSDGKGLWDRLPPNE